MKNKAVQTPLVVEARIDRACFERFAIFDAFTRKKAWRNPLLFALILSGFAAVCFSARAEHDGAVLLGSVLLGIGLLLPLVWIGAYLASVRKQAQAHCLSPDTVQYTLTLSSEMIHVRRGTETADFSWKDVYGAWRVRGCVYLYVSTVRAFLLPDGDAGAAVWETVSSLLGKERAHDRTRKARL